MAVVWGKKGIPVTVLHSAPEILDYHEANAALASTVVVCCITTPRLFRGDRICAYAPIRMVHVSIHALV